MQRSSNFCWKTKNNIVLVKQCKNQLTHTHTETNPTFQCDWANTNTTNQKQTNQAKMSVLLAWSIFPSFLHTSHAMRIYDAKLRSSPPRLTPPPFFLLCKYFIHSQTQTHTKKELTHTRSTRIIKWNNTERKKNKTIEENSGRKSWKTRKKLNTNKFKENQVRIL